MRGVEKSDEAVKASSTRMRMRSYSTSSLEQTSHEHDHEEGRSNTKSHSHHTTESVSERSNSDYSVIQRVKSDFIGTFSSSNRNIKGRGGSHSLINDHVV